MVGHVCHVIRKHEPKSYRLGAGYRTRARPIRIGYPGSNDEKLPIQRRPRLDEFTPLSFLVYMRLHPSLLLVSRHGRLAFHQRADDPLMVVGRGV